MFTASAYSVIGASRPSFFPHLLEKLDPPKVFSLFSFHSLQLSRETLRSFLHAPSPDSCVASVSPYWCLGVCTVKASVAIE